MIMVKKWLFSVGSQEIETIKIMLDFFSRDLFFFAMDEVFLQMALLEMDME